MRIAFFTLGCKVNQYETQQMREHFLSLGDTLCDPEEEADVYVINSCTVTASADKKTRQMVRRFKREHPQSIVALVGCFPQAFPAVAQELTEADIVCGVKDKIGLSQKIKQCLNEGHRLVEVTPHRDEEKLEPSRVVEHSEKTRAFVKIEDGCERFCSYCIIPTARGKVRSKAIVEIQEEVEELVRRGYREVVLVGINLSMYGWDCGLRLVDAVQAVCQISGLERVRLGSTEPILVTGEDFIHLSQLPNLCPHFHIALQSGCQATLERMNRPYTPEQYMEIVTTVRKHFENPAITTDIMVGFPGETEEEFQESLEFVKRLQPSMAHIFPFSPRAGTPACDLPMAVDEQTKAERVKKLQQVCAESRTLFLQQQLGQETSVLFENIIGPYGRMGHTPNYTPVYVKDDQIQRGEIHPIVLTQSMDGFCLGERIPEATDLHSRGTHI